MCMALRGRVGKENERYSDDRLGWWLCTLVIFFFLFYFSERERGKKRIGGEREGYLFK